MLFFFSAASNKSKILNPCVSKPCGEHANCKTNSKTNQPICSCQEGYIGSPPFCQLDCMHNSDCTLQQACLNNQCTNPCTASVCGQNADCRVINHRPICACKEGYTGDPFTSCIPSPGTPVVLVFGCGTICS